MPYPAYEGQQFYFSMTVGLTWRHEFRTIDRNGTDILDWTGWTAEAVLTDTNGALLATLTTAGADGTILLGDPDLDTDAISLTLPAAVTAGLPSTRSLSGQDNKSFVFLRLTLTDPARPVEPYIYAAGKGVINPA